MESKAVLQRFRLTDPLGTFRRPRASPQQRLGMGQRVWLREGGRARGGQGAQPLLSITQEGGQAHHSLGRNGRDAPPGAQALETHIPHVCLRTQLRGSYTGGKASQHWGQA